MYFIPNANRRMATTNRTSISIGTIPVRRITLVLVFGVVFRSLHSFSQLYEGLTSPEYTKETPDHQSDNIVPLEATEKEGRHETAETGQPTKETPDHHSDIIVNPPATKKNDRYETPETVQPNKEEPHDEGYHVIAAATATKKEDRNETAETGQPAKETPDNQSDLLVLAATKARNEGNPNETVETDQPTNETLDNQSNLIELAATTVGNEENQNETETLNRPQWLQEYISVVGEPHSRWTGNESTWIPAEGSRLYKTQEFRRLFMNKCTLFVGDSLQRRAADTLHLMLRWANNETDIVTSQVPEEIFTDEFFNSKKHDRGYKERFLDPSHDQQNAATGCISTDWRPLLSDVDQFTKEYWNSSALSKHNVVVIGSTVWEVDGSRRVRRNAIEIRENVNRTIYLLRDNIPSSTLIIWRSSGWCANCPWTPSEQEHGRGDNYRIFAANDEAKKVIAAIGAPNILYLDWGREILPKSVGELRLASPDGNKYHYGNKARLQFLQMLAEMYDQQDPYILNPPSSQA